MLSSGGEIIAVFKSSNIMARLCGIKNGKLGRLEQINKHATIKCLVSDGFEPSLLSLSFQLRTIMRQHIGAYSCFVYGKKHAIVASPEDGSFIFLVFNSMSEAVEHKKHFFTLWEMAPPVLAQYKNQDRRVSA